MTEYEMVKSKFFTNGYEIKNEIRRMTMRFGE